MSIRSLRKTLCEATAGPTSLVLIDKELVTIVTVGTTLNVASSLPIADRLTASAAECSRAAIGWKRAHREYS